VNSKLNIMFQYYAIFVDFQVKSVIVCFQFFNKNCSLGKTNRCVSNGLIEVAWYIPSGKAKNFTNVAMVLNLRGY
jgi:hypothetical protein